MTFNRLHGIISQKIVLFISSSGSVLFVFEKISDINIPRIFCKFKLRNYSWLFKNRSYRPILQKIYRCVMRTADFVRNLVLILSYDG
jgi:hypothetical protein